jgi:hypothetical protein
MSQVGPSLSLPLAALGDDELLQEIRQLLGASRRVESQLVAHLAEADARRLYAREAFPSMFAYCTDALRLSEAEAYLRISVARASREHPVLLEMLADGRLYLSGIAKLAPHLTLTNRDSLLARAVHKSKREVEELIADLAPQPAVPATFRKLPAASPRGATRLRPLATASAQSDEFELRPDGVDVLSATRPPVVAPLGRERYRVQFTASAGLRDKLERLKTLLRHRHITPLTPCTGRRPAHRPRARREPLRLRERLRPAMCRRRGSRIPPSASVRDGRHPRPDQRPPPLPDAQRLAG